MSETGEMACIGCGEVFNCRDDAQSIYHQESCQYISETWPEINAEINRRLRRPTEQEDGDESD